MSKKTSGILRGVEISQAPDKSWKKASLKIEKEGKTITLSTFKADDIEKANQLNGKEIEAEYTLTQKGDRTYKNLVTGGLKEIGLGEALVTEEEEVVDVEEIEDVKEEKKEAEVIMTEKEGRKMGQQIPVSSLPEKPKYKVKFVEDETDYKRRQVLILRQNSFSQANNYLANIVKAVEVGILKPVEVSNEDLNLGNLKKIAHEIEEDIMRVK